MSLEIVNQFPFEFYGEVFELYVGTDLQPYAPVRAMCDALGIDPSAQLQRIKRDEVLAESLVIFTLKEEGDWGGARQISCLLLRRLPYWLGTLDTNRIKSEHREKVVMFKREFAEVAWAAFRSAIFPEDVLAEMDATKPPLEQDYHRLMDETAKLREKLSEQEKEIDEVVTRVAGLEARFLGTDFINPAQASQIRRMISVLVGKIESNKGKQSRVYANVHGTLKKHFDVPSYLLIAEKDFPKVAEFLSNWYKRVAHEEPPEFFQSNQQTLL